MVMFPAVSVFVAPSLAVALIFAPSPMVTWGELISIFPAFPALLVSTDNWVLLSRLNVSVASIVMLPPVPSPSVKANISELFCMLILLASRSMLPAFPAAVVDAVISMPSAIVRFWVLMLILPASPAPVVSTEIFPSPEISIFSGAVILMLPPLPVEVVRAEMKPWLLKLMSQSGVLL